MLALLASTWTILVFSIAAMALGPGRISRSGAMVSILVCVGLAPTLMILAKLGLGIDAHPALSMLSPFTAAYDLTLVPAGVTPRPTSQQVWLALAPIVPAIVALWLARGGPDTDPSERLH